jgi:DNA polymerase-3 subunit alpha
VDLRTVNKRVMESLIKANAVASLGTAGALLAALDAALESGQRHQRDVAAGQSTMFDLFAVPDDASVAFLDGGEEIPRRERLRWEKELIGLYLSEHPLGDIADVLPDYVTAFVGDLAEESDQAKVTIGGIIQSSRRVVTRAGSTMLVATVEDLQGAVEVVVFPKVFEQTANSWTDDSVVLVTGRIDRRDETPQILCEAVHQWDDAVRMGPVGRNGCRASGRALARASRSLSSRPSHRPLQSPSRIRRKPSPSPWACRRRRRRRPLHRTRCRSSPRRSRPRPRLPSRSATTCRPISCSAQSSR